MRPNCKVPSWKVILCVLTTILVAGACSSDQPQAAAGDGCVINTDCSSPLVCAFRKCHMACTDTRDCPPSQRCMASDRPFHVCQLPQETKCGYNSDCPNGQICAVDGECRDQCASDRDCVTRQVCTAGSCAEIVELDDAGTLPVVVTDEASTPSTGQPCQYNSDCPGDQICRSSGLCAPECLHDRDCPGGFTCGESGRCTANASSSGSGGTNSNIPDATVGGADATTGGPDVAAGGTCANKIKDGTETDVDCGGTCPPCATGSGCTGPNDCASGKCDTRVCQMPTCSDTIKNGSESAIDCGGTCDPCPNGMACSKGTDCATGLCIGSACHALDCTDGQHDGDETDVDCGGATCPKCDNQKACGDNPDCKSDFCSVNVCQATGCNDGRKSGSETDVDCGGPECKKCATSQACAASGDCATGVCTGLVCQGSKCDDKIKNGNETDVDCGGGGCVTCVAGMKCVRGTDCASGACAAGLCKATFPLTVVPAGGGAGRVTSTPAGIDCGATCVTSFPAGTGVQLSAAPSLNSAFAGWAGGGCTGSGACIVTMNSAQSVTATFAPSTAGVVNWSKVITTLSTDAGYLVAFDPQGNLFVAGTFSGAFDFGAGLVTSVGADIFLAKYSSSGAYQWARHFSGSQPSPNAIAVDANGDVYLAGQFVSTINLGNGGLTCTAGGGYYQGFVAKYVGSGAMQGTFAWQHCMGSVGSTVTTNAVSATPTGEMLVAGDVAAGATPADFGGMTLTGPPGSFVARYAGDGTLTSLKKPFSSPGGGGTHAYAISVDASGNIVIGGSFTYTADFGNGSIASIGGSEDAYIAKLKPDTSYMWSKIFGDVGSDRVTGVAVDAAGNVAYAGSFFGQIDIGTVETSAGDRDIVVGKCAAADGAYLWGRRFGGPNGDFATGIAMNAGGDVVFTGAIGGSVDFGGGPLGTFGGADIFVAKFFANKSYAWSNSWGSAGDDIGNGVAFNASGAVGIAGVVSGPVDFGDVAPRYGSSGDSFLLKLTP